MKQKIISLIMVFGVLLQFLMPVSAAETQSEKICSAYWDQGTLYTFMQFDEEEAESLKCRLVVNGAQAGEAYPKTVKDADATIHFMFLIDTSNSMRNNQLRVRTLVQELMKTEQEITVSLAQFGSRIEILGSRMSEWDEVKKAFGSLSFSDEGSDISGSAAAMLEKLGSEGYSEEGEMTNLVVITDGEPWYSEIAKKEREMRKEANETLTRMRAAYPEIVLHTYSFKKWDADTEEALADERGLHQVKTYVKDMGAELGEYAASVYALEFHLKGYDDYPMIPDEMTLNVLGKSLHTYSYGTVRNVGTAPIVSDPPEQTKPTEEPTAPATEPPTEPTGVAETDPTEGTEPLVPGATGDPEDNAPPSEPDSTEPTGSAETTVPGGDGPIGKKFPIGYVALGVLLLFGGILFWLFRKNHVPRDAIRMKIELVAGENVRLKNVYYLDREILIGSGRSCDIRIPDRGQEGASARLFKQNQIVYVEELGASGCVLLNGMRIFSSNRLRSGDEITVGPVILRILF